MVDAQKHLDKNIRYLLLLKLDENNHLQIRVVYEHTEDSKKYGHPTLAKNSSDNNYRELLGGELYFDKKSNDCNINNDSGRYGFPYENDNISIYKRSRSFRYSH